jgi:hypothetical protein
MAEGTPPGPETAEELEEETRGRADELEEVWARARERLETRLRTRSPSAPPTADDPISGTPEELALVVRGRLFEMVQELARWQRRSVSDVIRSAITTEYVVREALQQGKKLLLEAPDRTVSQVNLR